MSMSGPSGFGIDIVATKTSSTVGFEDHLMVSLRSGELDELKSRDEQLEGEPCSKTASELTLSIGDNVGNMTDIRCERAKALLIGGRIETHSIP